MCLVVEVRIGLPVLTSDHSAVFINVEPEQLILYLVCRQKVYLKNAVDLGLVR